MSLTIDVLFSAHIVLLASCGGKLGGRASCYGVSQSWVTERMTRYQGI